MFQSKDEVVEWIHKKDAYICCAKESHFRCKDIHRLKIRNEKRYSVLMGTKRKPGSNIYIRQTRFYNLDFCKISGLITAII